MSLFELRSEQPVPASLIARGQAPAGVHRRPGRGGTSWWALSGIVLLAACAMTAAVGTTVVNGDGIWHLVWGRQLAHGSLETFATGPTPHPSLIALGAATSVLGDDLSYLVTYLLLGPLAFGVLVAAVFEVARRLSSYWGAAAAVLIVVTSAAVVSQAVSARSDLAFAALVLAAVALEMGRPRRGGAPLVCLAAAGLLRPEAWLLAAVYWLWLAPHLSWPMRLRFAALVAAAPMLWALTDALVMGDPLYSLHVTDEASAGLYGQFSPWENLGEAARAMVRYVGVVPLLMLVPATALLVRDRPRAALPVVASLAITLGVFGLLLAHGMTSNERYLLVPACALAIVAAMALDAGWPRTRRRVALGAFFAALLLVQLVARADVYERARSDLTVVQERYDSAEALVGMPGVSTALRDCRRLAVPSNRIKHLFAFFGNRPPEAFVRDDDALVLPELFIAPANPQVAQAVLARPRFDADPSFRVHPSLVAGPRNQDWILYVSPAAPCARGLL